MNKSDKSDSFENLSLEWKNVEWVKIHRHVFKLQRYIFNASRNGDITKVRELQHTLLNSISAKLLAVRRVTEDNLGKRTAGVDGVKVLEPEKRILLAQNLKITGSSQPSLRVWIPKPGSQEKRPLGIPTIQDRALQALVTMALEPEWEARLEPNSYGFRPGRSAHDAIKQIKIALDKKAKFVLEADIAKCFDSIDHDALLKKLGVTGKLRQQIRAWLKSGVLNAGVFEETEQGTPQGGVLSPLLANIALHGLETTLKEQMRKYSTMRWKGGSFMKPSERIRSLTVVRYADDFVVMHENKDVILEIKSLIETWLSNIGLQLKESKTRICHTFYPTLSEDQKAGFNFLGFHISHHKASSVRSSNISGKPLGFRTVIVPSAKSCKNHQSKIDETISKFTSQSNLIAQLNPIIRGWSRYFSASTANEGYEILKKQDFLTYIKLRRWSIRRTKSSKSGLLRFWHPIGARKWVFSTGPYDGNLLGRDTNLHSDQHNPSKSQKKPLILANHIDTKVSIDSYIKVKGISSPFDGNILYWTRRMKKFSMLPSRKTTLLRSQNGKCAFCGGPFYNVDILHEHHVRPRSSGGKDILSNLQLVHVHCHHRIHGLHDGDTMPLTAISILKENSENCSPFLA